MTYETTVVEPFVAIRDLVHQWCQDVTDYVENFGDCYAARVDEVENESRSGFFPYTQGGYEGIVNASISDAYGSGAVPAAIQPYLDSDLEEAEKEWDSQHPEHTVAWIYGEEGELLPGDREDWRDQWRDFEHEWLQQGGTYFYKVRALFFDTDNTSNTSGKPEVFFLVGLNTDFEYGRDTIDYSGSQETQWCWKRTVPVDEITAELVETMTEEAIAALVTL